MAAKSANKPKGKLITVVTPVATASFPYLDKPDTAYATPDKPAKFKVQLVFPGDTDFTNLRAKLTAAVAQEWGDKLALSKVRLPLKSGDDINEARVENDKKPVENLAGKWVIDASSAYKPQTTDTAKKAIDAKLIQGGDKVRAVITLVPCTPSGTKTVGIRLQLVQLVEKREGRDWTDSLDDIDGFTAGDDDDAAPNDDDEGDAGEDDF
jgi:hypothetical protein